MEKETLLVKTLTYTDVKQALYVPLGRKNNFLNFGRERKLEFEVMDDKDKVWEFGCSRRMKGHPKPVLSKGWRQFVKCWELAEGDKVIFYRTRDTARQWYKRIEVIRREVSPPTQSHDEDRATDVEEATITPDETEEGLHNQPVLMFEFIRLKPDINEAKVINCFELGSEE